MTIVTVDNIVKFATIYLWKMVQYYKAMPVFKELIKNLKIIARFMD